MSVRALERWLPLAVALLWAAALAPAIVFRYLPMTDLPQHTAVVAILRHLGDPGWGFDPYYDLSLGRTLYVLPYGLALLLSTLLPVMLSMKLVAALATAAYPAGVWMFLRAQRKPAWLTLLALPLVFNRAFYWGFVNFLLSIGLVLAALSIIVAERKSWRSDVVLALLCIGAATTHIYGVAFLIGYLVIWAMAGDRAPLVRRLPALIPALVGTIAWTLLATQAPPYGVYEYLDPLTRARQLSDSVLGGFADRSEDVLLAGLAVGFALVSAPSLPVTWARWFRLGRHEKIAYAYALLNLLLYFALPMHTPSVKYLHFRHALLAFMLLPLAATGDGARRWPRLAGGALAALALFAVGNVWIHLGRFQREAAGFDVLLERLPERPKLAAVIYDVHGKVMKTFPYLHFPAYAQAVKGGVTATTFPRMFWNMPVRFDEKSGVPPTTPYLEWKPETFSDQRLGRFYQSVIGKLPAGTKLPDDFPFVLLVEQGEWKLYRRR